MAVTQSNICFEDLDTVSLQDSEPTSGPNDGAGTDLTTSSPVSLSLSSDSDWEELEADEDVTHVQEENFVNPQDGEHAKNLKKQDEVNEEDNEQNAVENIMAPDSGKQGATACKGDADMYLPLLKTLSATSSTPLPTGTLTTSFSEGTPVSLTPIAFLLSKQQRSTATSLRGLAWLLVLILSVSSAYLVLEMSFWDSATEAVVPMTATPLAMPSVPEKPLRVGELTVAVVPVPEPPTRRWRPRAVATAPSTTLRVRNEKIEVVDSFANTNQANETLSTKDNRTLVRGLRRINAFAHDLAVHWITIFQYSLADPSIHAVAAKFEPVVRATRTALSVLEKDVIQPGREALVRAFKESGVEEFYERVVRGAKKAKTLAVEKTEVVVRELKKLQGVVVEKTRVGKLSVF